MTGELANVEIRSVNSEISKNKNSAKVLNTVKPV